MFANMVLFIFTALSEDYVFKLSVGLQDVSRIGRWFPATARPSCISCGQSHAAITYNEYKQLEMWANAQHDGRPAEYRWHPLFNAARFG